jgi:hypothetical protein
MRGFRNKHCFNLICVKNDVTMHCRKSMYSKTGRRVEKLEEEISKNHPQIIQNITESVTNLLIVLKV